MRFVFLSFCLFVFLSFCLFVFLSFCLFVFLSFCLFVFLSFCLFVFLMIFYDFLVLSSFIFIFSIYLSIRESHKTIASTFEARLLREKEALLPSGTRETRSTVKTTAASVPPEKSERKNVDAVHPALPFCSFPRK